MEYVVDRTWLSPFLIDVFKRSAKGGSLFLIHRTQGVSQSSAESALLAHGQRKRMGFRLHRSISDSTIIGGLGARLGRGAADQDNVADVHFAEAYGVRNVTAVDENSPGRLSKEPVPRFMNE